jgi:hypothetical protein
MALRLNLGELEDAHQLLLAARPLADDPDHPVEVEIDDEQAAQDLQPPVDVPRAETRGCGRRTSPGDGRAIPSRHSTSPSTFGTLPPGQNVHVQGDAALQLGEPEQGLHEDDGVHRPGAGLEDHADVLGGFVAHVRQQGQLLLLEQFGDLLDQAGFGHRVGISVTTICQLPRPRSSLAQRARTRNEPRPVR